MEKYRIADIIAHDYITQNYSIDDISLIGEDALII